MNPRDKPLVWLRGEIKTPPFSPEARIEAGFLLSPVAAGRIAQFAGVATHAGHRRSCHELRIGDRDHTWRIVYHIAADAIVVLEVFSKKTAAIPHSVAADCRRRLQAYLRLTHKKGVTPRGKK
jgi:phage-related protein